jgi:hypothetical protein
MGKTTSIADNLFKTPIPRIIPDKTVNKDDRESVVFSTRCSPKKRMNICSGSVKVARETQIIDALIANKMVAAKLGHVPRNRFPTIKNPHKPKKAITVLVRTSPSKPAIWWPRAP